MNDLDDLQLAKTVGLELDATVAASSASDAAQGGSPAISESPRQRFELGREIGRGGMGRVLEATDHQFRRGVAIKEMLPGGDLHAKKRFITEALVTGNLQHPGIPAVYERGERKDGTSYYAMQLVSGRTLADALDEAGSLDERVRLLPTVIKVAETCAFAHERGVVHRDLKPENVLVGRHGQVFLLDWGIAKVRGLTANDPTSGALNDNLKTQVGTLMGSPMYMAPEQARGDVGAIDERTDVFALGAMLYHVLTGKAPYQGRTVMELATKAAEGAPPPVTSLAPGVNRELALICQKAMQRDPAERHQSALELAAALESFQSQAAQKPPSRLLAGVQGAGLGAVILMATVLFALGVMSFVIAVTAHHGVLPFISMFTTLTSLALVAVEYQTHGRAKLVGVGLALALITFCVVLTGTAMGIIHTSESMQGPEMAHDVAGLVQDGAKGFGESMWNFFGGMPLALAQIVAWALVARRNALREIDPERLA